MLFLFFNAFANCIKIMQICLICSDSGEIELGKLAVLDLMDESWGYPFIL
jgi:hypothetical protein